MMINNLKSTFLTVATILFLGSVGVPLVTAQDVTTGKITYEDGYYQGEIYEGKPHGRGIRTWSNGNRYEGDFDQGKRHGRGVFTWSNGDRYEGDFNKDWRHGKGVYTEANGNRYEGDFDQGWHHGKGVYTEANGDRYEGDFDEGKRHGKGILTEADGSRYEGTWENNVYKDYPRRNRLQAAEQERSYVRRNRLQVAEQERSDEDNSGGGADFLLSFLGAALETYTAIEMQKFEHEVESLMAKQHQISSQAPRDNFTARPLRDFNITMTESNRMARICVRDHECEDGDAVEVSVNGVAILKTELQHKQFCADVNLSPGRNSIKLLALNGTGYKGNCSYQDANTGEIAVRPLNNSRYFQTQTWKHRGGGGSSAHINVTID